MKNLFLVVLALCVYIPQANAQKVKDQEFRRVVVTLTSGEKVEGYVKRGWHAEASAFKKSNYSFKMTATPDDKEVLKYTADEVVCIDYTEKTENNPDGIRWESRELASPSIADRYRTIRRLVCLENTGEQQLYELIYKRTLASQMADAQLERTNMIIGLSNHSIPFTATGEVIIFDGFLKVYMESHDEETDDEQAGLLPALAPGDQLQRQFITAIEQYTLHPPRYTEASLVKKMEALGIGRPSTYAPTITTIQNRGYIIKESREGVERNIEQIELKGNDIKIKPNKKIFGAEKKKLFPSDMGMVVTDFLSEHFTNIMDYNFTAEAEEALDDIAEGSVEWQKMIGEFYHPFHETVESTLKNSERNSGQRILGTDPVSGETVSVRIGRFGPMAQIGEGEHVRYAGLLKGQLMETITLEEALGLFKFPRKIGQYEDKDVSIGIGRFGPDIKHNNVFVSLKKGEDDPGTITLETAIQRIEEKRESDRNKLIKAFDNGVQILNGRFGPYISYNKANYKIPKTCKADELTLEKCMELIEKEGSKKKPGGSSKKTPVRKAQTTTKKKN
jgi:DNA topoisomerase I